MSNGLFDQSDSMPEQSPSRRRGRPRKNDAGPIDGKTTVLALDRGLRALVFLAESGGASLTDISRNVETPVATMHRILATLRQRGMAGYDADSGIWSVGPQAYRVGAAYRQSHNLLEIASQVMERMSKETGETSNLAIEDEGNLLYLIQVESDNPIRASIKNGTTAYFHTSGVGKAMMAYMDQARLDRILDSQALVRQTPKTITDADELLGELARVRQRGWALDDEERFLGMRCIAAPVFDQLGQVVAGVSVSGPSSRFSDEAMDDLVQSVVGGARHISDRLRDASA